MNGQILEDKIRKDFLDQIIPNQEMEGNWFVLKDEKVFSRQRENDMQEYFKARQ